MMAGIASGKEAVAEIGVSHSKIGAGSSNEAANNLKTIFLPKISPDMRNSLLIWVLIAGSIAS